MNTHRNTRLMPYSRGELVRRMLEDGQMPEAVAATFSISTTTPRT